MTKAPPDLLAKMLARRDLSIAEARERLAAAGVDASAVEATVAWGQECGYLDDARLTERLVERELAKAPPPAAELIQAKLEGRGLDAALVATAVRSGADAQALAARALSWVIAVRGRVAVRKLYARLVRVGHEPEVVTDWLAKAGLDPDPEDKVQVGDLRDDL